MNATASDYRDAWVKAEAFLQDKTETYLMLGVDTEPYKTSYTVVKLPYGENIALLYAIESNQADQSPCSDLKYSGFFGLSNGKAYDIRTPLDRFFGFERIPKDMICLKGVVKDAIQGAVADHIADHAEEYSGIPGANFSGDGTEDAVKAFSVKQTKLYFGKKIEIRDWSISDRDMVDFIADPDAFLTKKVEAQIRERKEELARLWVAHCAAQKILDRLNAETAGGNLI